MKAIIKANEPFPGYAQSFLYDDGTVAFSEDKSGRRLTLAEYEAQRGPMRVVDDDELGRLLLEHDESQISEPTPITFEAYHQALNVLPPCRWERYRGIRFFHISERIAGEMVTWYACVGSEMDENSRFFTFTDRSSATFDHLADKVMRCA